MCYTRHLPVSRRTSGGELGDAARRVRSLPRRPRARAERGARLDEAVTRKPQLSGMRIDYLRDQLREQDLAPTWLAQFEAWFDDAVRAGLPEPNAMVLATATPDGRPSARTVLLKDIDVRGFVWYTNLTSRKGTEIAANPYASAVFSWHPIGRQVVVAGRVDPVDRAQTEAYFAGRPVESRRGAWASPQSQVVPDRDFLDAALARVEQEYGPDGPTTPPEHWGGLRLVPETVEFWQGRTGRLHDRLRYRHTEPGWVVERLAP
jgi:pyridoxamine 5'-phosphate oxidase